MRFYVICMSCLTTFSAPIWYIASYRKMADELEKIWKKVIEAWKSFYYGICLKQLRKLTKALPRTQVLNINLDHCVISSIALISPQTNWRQKDFIANDVAPMKIITKINVSYCVTPCCLLELCQQFGETCCLHFSDGYSFSVSSLFYLLLLIRSWPPPSPYIRATFLNTRRIFCTEHGVNMLFRNVDSVLSEGSNLPAIFPFNVRLGL